MPDKALATVPHPARHAGRGAVTQVVLSPKSLLRCSASYYCVAGIGSGKPAPRARGARWLTRRAVPHAARGRLA